MKGKKIATTVFTLIVLGFIAVILYSIFCNASGILESFISIPIGYLVSGLVGAVIMFIALKFTGCIRIPMSNSKIKKLNNSETPAKLGDFAVKPKETNKPTEAGTKK